MFDQRQYIKDKIINKLTQSDEYDVKFNDSVSELLDNINVGLMPQRADVFEDTVVGWVNFCNIIKELLLEGLSISLENFKEKFSANSKVAVSEKTVTQSEVVIDETILDEEDPRVKFERLSKIADDVDLFDEHEEEFLTEAGLRAMGVINKDATSLDGEVISSNTSNAAVVYLKEGEEIISPFSGTNNIFQISSFKFMDIDTDQEFYVYFSKP